MFRVLEIQADDQNCGFTFCRNLAGLGTWMQIGHNNQVVAICEQHWQVLRTFRSYSDS